MKKITITGIERESRMLLTQALSYLTGYDIVRQTAYSGQAIKYGLNKELKDCRWHELFIYVFSSFSERIKIEQHYEKFISNGSVFNELAYMEAFCKSSVRMNKERIFMLSGIRKIILEYAIREYDCVIHLGNSDSNFEINTFSNDLDKSIRSLAENCKTKFFIQKDSLLTDILEKVSTEIDIKPTLSVGTALRMAKQVLYNS